MDMRDSKGRFLPGITAGPGRPKKAPTAKEKFETLTQEAVDFLSNLMHSDDKDTAIKACIEIIKFAMLEEKKSSKSGISLAEFWDYVKKLPEKIDSKH